MCSFNSLAKSYILLQKYCQTIERNNSFELLYLTYQYETSKTGGNQPVFLNMTNQTNNHIFSNKIGKKLNLAKKNSQHNSPTLEFPKSFQYIS